MTLANHRHERVAEEIHHEVSAMLAGELKDPRVSGLITLTEVRVTPDLKHARVFVSVYGTPAERTSARKGLEAAGGYIRRELTHRLQMRRMPELHFILDMSGAEGDRIDDLLRKALGPEQTKQE
jgi:ribosome-binding factor A